MPGAWLVPMVRETPWPSASVLPPPPDLRFNPHDDIEECLRAFGESAIEGARIVLKGAHYKDRPNSERWARWIWTAFACDLSGQLVAMDGAGMETESARKQAERRRKEGRRALAALGAWPWALAPEGRLPLMWARMAADFYVSELATHLSIPPEIPESLARWIESVPGAGADAMGAVSILRGDHTLDAAA